MNHRIATEADCPLLARLNRLLIIDEQHRNKMTEKELEGRMRQFLCSGYVAVLFEEAGETAAYALYRESAEEIYLRQLYVAREKRRHGIGRRAMEILRSHYWDKAKRQTLEVLVTNTAAIEFWKAMGYGEYCVTMERMPENAS